MKERYPEPPKDSTNATEHAEYLAALIHAGLGLTVSPQAVREFRIYLSRVGPENFHDLIGSIFLECWKEYREKGGLTERGIRLAADRVRQRLIRRLKRETPTAAPELTPADDLPPEDEIQLILKEFHTFLSQRPPQDALLFQRYYIDNDRNIDKLAEEFGISPATVYRRLKSIRDDFAALRGAQEKPHTSD
jgi:RNA polymerase sigma factor (sigma-70 family)